MFELCASGHEATTAKYLPRDIQAEFVSPVENGLQVRWADDGHESVYTWDWLERHGPKSNVSQETPLRRRFWGNEIKHSPPSVRYSDVMRDDEGVQEWTRKIVRCLLYLEDRINNWNKHEYGMCYVDDCPVYPKATQELLERIAQIRHTHYGIFPMLHVNPVRCLMQPGGFWDFTSDLASKDTAYTSLALSAHTDTTYFSDPAGLQLFHLLSHIEGSGGVSLLVDGFRAAMELKKRAPEAYHVLSRFQVPSHASGNDGLSIRPFAPFPVLNHDPVTGELVQVRWNNDDRDVLPHGDKYRDLEKWYDAAQQWVQLLRSEEAEFWDQLRPGRPLSESIGQ
ncbi:MAG: hypothetical protein M1823_005883 [Watsoniomyces obsoletus]|nr:MAG: hypothetical protein M1823_005883 [Watsoniomyces obsoletus]